MKYILVTIISLFSFSIFSQELSPEDTISKYLLNHDYEFAICLFSQARTRGDSPVFTFKHMGITYIMYKNKKTKYHEKNFNNWIWNFNM